MKRKIQKLESELVKSRTENEQLIFDLRIAKTKAACLEEKLAQYDLNDFTLTPPQQVNVTVNSTNYGCFGLGGVNKLRIRLESPDQLR